MTPLIDSFVRRFNPELQELSAKLVKALHTQRDEIKDTLAFIKQSENELKAMHIAYLERIIDEHDCHLSEMDGCDCLELKEKLRELKGQPKSIIH